MIYMKIFQLKNKCHYQKEWEALCKKEKKYLEQRKNKKESKLTLFLAEKVPEKMQSTLDKAFEKAFFLIFEKGTAVIEKTYKKEEMEKEYKIHIYADGIHKNRKSFQAFSKGADKVSGRNLTLSALSGMGMGLLGIGLPDIPVFTGMILRCIYEIAINYGFDYHSEEEKYFVLLLIEGAVSYDDHLEEINNKIDTYIRERRIPNGCIPAEQIVSTSSMLSRELLYMKFLQGVPIAGVVGGAYDVVYMKRISEYAKLKYKKRFLLNHIDVPGTEGAEKV